MSLIKVELPEKLAFLQQPKRFKVAFGGRGGSKTIGFAISLLLRGLEESIRVLCLREYMKSTKQSVHATLVRWVQKLGLDAYYDCKETYIVSKINDTRFMYDGLTGGANSLKSYDNISVAWVEEAETVSQKSLDNLIRTIREDGSELWFSFNPEDEFGPVYSEFVTPFISQLRESKFYEDDKHSVCWINLEDNPFAPIELVDDSAKLKAQNYRKWLWIYGGECYSDYQDAIIKPEWFDAAIDAHIKLGFKPLGVKSAGLDLADMGDAKACVGRHGVLINQIEEWQDGDIVDALDKGFSYASDWGCSELVYDANGVGKAGKVYIAKVETDKLITPHAYFDSGAILEPDKEYLPGKTNADTFRNRRAQDYYSLADRFEATYNAVENGIYTDPDKLISIDSTLSKKGQLKSELIKIKRDRSDNTRRKIQSKQQAIKEGIKSPNLADALKMCFGNPVDHLLKKKPKRINFVSEF